MWDLLCTDWSHGALLAQRGSFACVTLTSRITSSGPPFKSHAWDFKLFARQGDDALWLILRTCHCCACSWLPQHLILREASEDGGKGRILGAVPLYMVR